MGGVVTDTLLGVRKTHLAAEKAFAKALRGATKGKVWTKIGHKNQERKTSFMGGA